MIVIDYLRAKYGVPWPSTMLGCEATAFSIPYPLPSGWLAKYGDNPITPEVAARLEAALRKSTRATAADGLRVLSAAHLELKRLPAANAADFLESKAWKRLRLAALKAHGSRCQSCGASPSTGAFLNVDHVLPRRLFPELALRLDNLQVLCADCNEGKGNWDMTDFREGAAEKK